MGDELDRLDYRLLRRRRFCRDAFALAAAPLPPSPPSPPPAPFPHPPGRPSLRGRGEILPGPSFSAFLFAPSLVLLFFIIFKLFPAPLFDSILTLTPPFPYPYPRQYPFLTERRTPLGSQFPRRPLHILMSLHRVIHILKQKCQPDTPNNPISSASSTLSFFLGSTGPQRHLRRVHNPHIRGS